MYFWGIGSYTLASQPIYLEMALLVPYANPGVYSRELLVLVFTPDDC